MQLKSLESCVIILCVASVAPAVGQLSFGSYDNFGQVQHWQHGSVYYKGKVTVAGDSLPWDPIPVVVTCNGVPERIPRRMRKASSGYSLPQAQVRWA
jgi:hypothetical protein